MIQALIAACWALGLAWFIAACYLIGYLLAEFTWRRGKD